MNFSVQVTSDTVGSHRLVSWISTLFIFRSLSETSPSSSVIPMVEQWSQFYGSLRPSSQRPLRYVQSHSFPLSKSIKVQLPLLYRVSCLFELPHFTCMSTFPTLTRCVLFIRHLRWLLGASRWLGSRWMLFPMSKQYWRTSGSWERAWSNQWKPGLKNGHFRQYMCRPYSPGIIQFWCLTSEGALIT